MEKHDGLITEDDTVYNIITAHPELKEVLESISPKFRNLQNPLVFNTVAKVTSLKKAAAVGGIYLKELLYRLNDAIGKGGEFLEYFKGLIPAMQEEFLKKQFGKAPVFGTEKPLWAPKTASFAILDATKLEGEPFGAIMERAKMINAGEGFVLVQNFVPAPIIAYLGTQGFESYTEAGKSGEMRTYFYKTEKEVTDNGK